MKQILTFIVLLSAAFCVVKCDDDIVQICDSEKDASCLRKYFSENAEGGSVVDEVTESPEYDLVLPVFLPQINLTVVCVKDYLGNLDGNVEEAYMDKRTGNLVISVNFDGLLLHAPDSYFSISRDGLEPKVLQEVVNSTYPAVLTAVIPASNGITTESLKNGRYSAFFPNSNAELSLGPKLTQSDDPEVLAVLGQLQANIPTALKEIFRTAASFFFLVYLQNYIYNFDMSPVLYNYDMDVLDRRNGVSDDDSNLSTICDGGDDATNCARDYFEKQGSCSVVRQSPDEPVTRDMFVAFVPYLNVSVYTMDAEISNLDGQIKELYMNEETNTLVMNVVFDGIVVESPESIIVIDKRGAQPNVLVDESEIKYPVSLTAVIPIGDDGVSADAISNTLVTARFPERNVDIKLGSSFSDSDDPQVKKILEEIKNNPTDIAVEIFTTEAYGMFFAYLQKYICDFDIPLSA